MNGEQRARRRMVKVQIEERGVRDPSVLAAMRRVPRDRFVPEDLRTFAHDDSPLPIGEGQTISQPFIVALMVEAMQVGPQDRVLEIGTGSGYAAAVLAEIAREVVTIERHAALADQARRNLIAAGYDQVQVIHADGSLGWPNAAPYDAILVSAGSPDVPAALRDQLAVGGRMVLPVGRNPRIQELVRITRTDTHSFEREDLADVRFVPLVGAQGWTEEDDDRARRPTGGR